MIRTKQSILLQLLFLLHFLDGIYTLQCKACEKTDPTCLLGHGITIETCPNEDDVCYSWFERSKGRVSVERACMSPHTAEYRTINKLLRGKDNDCIKRVNGLDCFKFCSSDNCN